MLMGQGGEKANIETLQIMPSLFEITKPLEVSCWEFGAVMTTCET
jgi:hypothetical protein